VRTWANDLPQYTQKYYLYRKASVALLSSDSGVVIFHYSQSDIQRKFYFSRNCVVRNNISYLNSISDFSDFVSFSE
jgi:hypothetical protein